jgi:hypothetical protein
MKVRKKGLNVAPFFFLPFMVLIIEIRIQVSTFGSLETWDP